MQILLLAQSAGTSFLASTSTVSISIFSISVSVSADVLISCGCRSVSSCCITDTCKHVDQLSFSGIVQINKRLFCVKCQRSDEYVRVSVNFSRIRKNCQSFGLVIMQYGAAKPRKHVSVSFQMIQMCLYYSVTTTRSVVPQLDDNETISPR